MYRPVLHYQPECRKPFVFLHRVKTRNKTTRLFRFCHEPFRIQRKCNEQYTITAVFSAAFIFPAMKCFFSENPMYLFWDATIGIRQAMILETGTLPQRFLPVSMGTKENFSKASSV